MTPRRATIAPPAGLAARRRAVDLLESVLTRRRPLDEAPDDPATLSNEDRAFARRLALGVLRRLGSIDAILADRLARGLPDGLPRLEHVLRLGVAQLLFLDVPAHAAVDLAVRLVEADRRSQGFVGLANAVLRGIDRDREALLAAVDPLAALPDWLRASWTAAYGLADTRAIAAAIAAEPPLDLTVKADPRDWARRLGGLVTPTGSVRLAEAGAVTALEGFAAGDWWVQDAAAALPARLLGDLSGKSVIDLCAAPGGKTAQLAHAGARVVAMDRSRARLMRLAENMSRLKLTVEPRVGDALQADGVFDAALLDAPCTATGTARRHPDVLWLKGPEDVAGLARVQAGLLARAAAIVRPGGTILYCTCSLQPEEGEDRIAAALAADPRLALDPIRPDELPGLDGLVRDGFLRTLPGHWPHEDPRLAGLDGFFAARLRVI